MAIPAPGGKRRKRLRGEKRGKKRVGLCGRLAAKPHPPRRPPLPAQFFVRPAQPHLTLVVSSAIGQTGHFMSWLLLPGIHRGVCARARVRACVCAIVT